MPRYTPHHSSTSCPSASAGVDPAAPATIIVVDDAYLMQQYHLTKSFLNQHSRRMGGFGKPRRFILTHVNEHLQGLAAASMERAGVSKTDRAMEKIETKKRYHQIIDMRLAADRIARQKARSK